MPQSPSCGTVGLVGEEYCPEQPDARMAAGTRIASTGILGYLTDTFMSNGYCSMLRGICRECAFNYHGAHSRLEVFGDTSGCCLLCIAVLWRQVQRSINRVSCCEVIANNMENSLADLLRGQV